MSARLFVLVAGLSMPLCAFARADDPPAPFPAPSDAPSDANALRGPTVAKHPDRPERSIVERDFNGRLKKLEDIPAMVALSRLDLSPEQHAAVDKVLGDRAAAIDAIVRDNLRLLIQLGGSGAAAAQARAELFEKAKPFLARGPILSEIKPTLPEDKFAELKRMVDEYNAVAIQERLAEPPAGEKSNRFGAMLAQGFEGFGQEARASYQRVFEAGGKDFEALLRMLELSPEQESKIRRRATDLFQKTYGKPTKGQQFRLFLDIYSELDTEQRHRLAEHIGEENRVRRTSGAAPKPAMGDAAKPETSAAPDDAMMSKP